MLKSKTFEIEIPTILNRHAPARSAARFLKGPIPMSELWMASRLPGQALAVYLAVRHQCDLTGRTTVTIPRSLLERFCIDKDAKSRALKSLSAAGLIKVDQQRGRSARITLPIAPSV